MNNVSVKKCTTTRANFIKNSYAQLLLYYYKMGVGNISEITGITITDVLVNAVERRYEQLGGNSTILRLRDYMPSKNGTIKKEEPKR